MIYSDPDNPEYIFQQDITFDGNWIIMGISKDTAPVNKLWIAKTEGGILPPDGTHLIYPFNIGKLEWIKIKDDFDSGLSLHCKQRKCVLL